MKPKFKSGDKVRYNLEYDDEFIIEDIIINNKKTEYILSPDWCISVSDDSDLELIESVNKQENSEQLAVEKFKEELKDKINNILNGRYKPWFEKVNGLKEEILEVLK